MTFQKWRKYFWFFFFFFWFCKNFEPRLRSENIWNQIIEGEKYFKQIFDQDSNSFLKIGESKRLELGQSIFNEINRFIGIEDMVSTLSKLAIGSPLSTSSSNTSFSENFQKLVLDSQKQMLSWKYSTKKNAFLNLINSEINFKKYLKILTPEHQELAKNNPIKNFILELSRLHSKNFNLSKYSGMNISEKSMTEFP